MTADQERQATAAEMAENMRKAQAKAEASRQAYLDEFETVYDGKGWTTKHKETGLSMWSHGLHMTEQRRAREASK